MLPSTSSFLRTTTSSSRLCLASQPSCVRSWRSYSTPTKPNPPKQYPKEINKPETTSAPPLETTPKLPPTPDPTEPTPTSSSPSPTSPAKASSNNGNNGNNNNLEELKESLRSWTAKTSAVIRNRADQYSAHAAHTFAKLGKELNKVTGYGEIEILKRRVVDQEQKIGSARLAAKVAKEEYDKAVHQRANSQREVNDLLQRKSLWTDDDVGRFTALVRKDHLFEQQESQAKSTAILTEAEVEREFTELMRVILNRYHEEQMWSDKIRSASTYGSLTVLGLNLLVFITAILFVEPWKRRRLAQTFERKVEEMTGETNATFEAKTDELVAHLLKQDDILKQLVETVYYTTRPPIESGEETSAEMENASIHGSGIKGSIVEELSIYGLKPPLWTTELPFIVGASATIAGVLGWAAGSWFGRL